VEPEIAEQYGRAITELFNHTKYLLDCDDIDKAAAVWEEIENLATDVRMLLEE